MKHGLRRIGSVLALGCASLLAPASAAAADDCTPALSGVAVSQPAVIFGANPSQAALTVTGTITDVCGLSVTSGSSKTYITPWLSAQDALGQDQGQYPPPFLVTPAGTPTAWQPTGTTANFRLTFFVHVSDNGQEGVWPTAITARNGGAAPVLAEVPGPSVHVIRATQVTATSAAPSLVEAGHATTVTGSIVIADWAAREWVPYTEDATLLFRSASGDATIGTTTAADGTATMTTLVQESGSFRWLTPHDYYSVNPSSAAVSVYRKTARITDPTATPALTRFGSTVTVTGHLTYGASATGHWDAYPGRVAALQFRRSPSSAWSTVTAATSSTTGALRASAPANHSGQYRWTYGNVSSATASSWVHKNQVRLRAVTASPKPVAVGRAVTVTGQLDVRAWDVSGAWFAYAGRTVALQYRRSGTTQWVTRKSISSSARGGLFARTTARHSGYYRWFCAGQHSQTVYVGVYRPV